MARTIGELSIFETFIYVITGWIVISTWQRFVENYAYNGIGLNRELPYHNFIVTMVLTGIFLVIISVAAKIIEEDGNEIVNQVSGDDDKEFRPGFLGLNSINDEPEISGELMEVLERLRSRK